MADRFPVFTVPPQYRGQSWSRTQGALGGREVWNRWVRHPMAVIGLGRSGSLVAESLAGSGVRSLCLIDPDVIEVHNLAEMALVDAADLGRPKVEAIAERLRARNPDCRIEAIPHGVTDPDARGIAAAHPWLFQCVDNDAARLAGALLATAYHRVLLDIGTGIQFADSSRSMGADIRLILPGDGCLLCRGGVSDLRSGIANALAGNLADRSGGNQSQRAGSLRSLNQVATGLALRMAEDVLTERLTRSTWLRLEFDGHGQVQIHALAPPPVTDCLGCARAGSGDALFSWTDYE